MSYQADKEFLGQHTQVVELTDGRGAHVAVCPAWQGRVMTSTCSGPAGPSFGFIHREFYEIESLSPARPLKTGETLVHRHRTIHVLADEATLAALAEETLGVELDAIRRAML